MSHDEMVKFRETHKGKYVDVMQKIGFENVSIDFIRPEARHIFE